MQPKVPKSITNWVPSYKGVSGLLLGEMTEPTKLGGEEGFNFYDVVYLPFCDFPNYK